MSAVSQTTVEPRFQSPPATIDVAGSNGAALKSAVLEEVSPRTGLLKNSNTVCMNGEPVKELPPSLVPIMRSGSLLVWKCARWSTVRRRRARAEAAAVCEYTRSLLKALYNA
jgi:hypothetical protein